jgi:hypothetical protein
VLEDLRHPAVTSEPVHASLRTAPDDARDVSFVWSGDLAGQGWGINPDAGGYRIFRAMAAVDPDFFLCSGDTVYADGPIAATVALPDGRTWRNVTTPAKAKVAETLDEFRGQYAYNLMDDALRGFAARVAQVNQWDDHEVTNNWYPGEVLTDDRYSERRVDVLAARSRQAFFEWLPIEPRAARAGTVYRKIAYGPRLDLFVLDMRTFKDPNGDNRYADPRRGLLGAEQRAWLKRELAASKATWKVLAIDLPLGLVVPDGPIAQEGVPQGDGGVPPRARARVRRRPDRRPPPRRDGDRDADRRRALHRRAPLRPRARVGGRVHAVLGVRLRPAQRRRLRPQRTRRDVRSRGRVRLGAADGGHRPGRRLPVLRRGGRRRAQRRDDRAPARHRRRGAVRRRPRARRDPARSAGRDWTSA